MRLFLVPPRPKKHLTFQDLLFFSQSWNVGFSAHFQVKKAGIGNYANRAFA